LRALWAGKVLGWGAYLLTVQSRSLEHNALAFSLPFEIAE
jgi:hypothetical protein